MFSDVGGGGLSKEKLRFGQHCPAALPIAVLPGSGRGSIIHSATGLAYPIMYLIP